MIIFDPADLFAQAKKIELAARKSAQAEALLSMLGDSDGELVRLLAALYAKCQTEGPALVKGFAELCQADMYAPGDVVQSQIDGEVYEKTPDGWGRKRQAKGVQDEVLHYRGS
jgi:hypothetical protein